MICLARSQYAVILSSLLAFFCVMSFLLKPLDTHAEEPFYQIADVEWGQTSNEFWVAIVGESPPTYTVYELLDPKRLVIDIANASLGFKVNMNIAPENSNIPLVTKIRGMEITDTEPAATRLEMTLSGDSSYNVERDGNDIVVVFKAKKQYLAEQKVEVPAKPTAPLPPPPQPIPPVSAVKLPKAQISSTYPANASVIFDVKVEPVPEETRVFLRADGPIKNFKKAELAKAPGKPHRMFIDIPEIRMPRLVKKKNVSGSLAGIRIGRRGSGVRIVFDSAMDSLFGYSIVTSPDGLLVTINEKEVFEPVAQLPPSEPELSVVEEKPVVQPVAKVEEPALQVIEKIKPMTEPAITKPSKVSKTLPSVTELIKPVIPATVAVAPKTVTTVAIAKIEETKSKPIPEVKQEGKKPLVEDEFGFAGFESQRITVDFFKVDLHNVFRLFGEISGRNIVVDEAVSGSLTLALNDVPWDFALDIILNLKDLQKEEQFNTIIISPKNKQFIWPERGTKNIAFKAGEPVVQEAITIKERKEQPLGVIEAEKFTHQARLKEKEGDFNQALIFYEKAFEKWPENSKVAKRISSLCLVNLGKNAKAVFYAKAALKVDPYDYDAALLAAVGLANMKKIMGAKQFFDLAISGAKPASEALRNYAAFSEENKSYNGALLLLDKHQELYGYNLDTMVSRARLYDKLGDKQKALQEYKAILNSGFDMPQDLKRYINGRIAMRQMN